MERTEEGSQSQSQRPEVTSSLVPVLAPHLPAALLVLRWKKRIKYSLSKHAFFVYFVLIKEVFCFQMGRGCHM